MNPHMFPDLYKSIFVGVGASAMRSPGVVTLSGHDRTQEWEKNKAKGQKGSSSVHNGSPIGEFQASFFLANEEDQAEWPAFKAKLESTINGEKTFALPCFHPDLGENGYTEISLSSMGGRVWDKTGGCIILVKLIEFKPPKPRSSSTATAKPSGKTPGKDTYDPNAATKRELAGLLAQADTV